MPIVKRTYDNDWLHPELAHEFAHWAIRAGVADRARVHFDRPTQQWFVTLISKTDREDNA